MTNCKRTANARKPVLLVIASTYPRWRGDCEPGFVHELSKRMTMDFDVTVLCPHTLDALRREKIDGVDVVRYRYAPARWETLVNNGGIVTNLRRARWKYLLVPSFVFSQAWHVWRLIREGRVDIVHAHWLLPQGAVAAAMQLLCRQKVPLIVTSHGADLYALRGRLMRAMKRFVVHRAAKITVVSAAMRDELVRLGIQPERIETRSMGVNLLNKFSPDPATRRSADELLFVGRLVEKKGLQYLIDAMPAVLRARPSAFLTVAGFGPEQDALREKVDRLGLRDKVTFLGAVPQEELPSLYRRAALFVAPFVKAHSGDEEGLGLVLVEAIGCGCPVLVGNVPAMADVLVDSSFDEVKVDARDTRALAGRIVAMLSDAEVIQKRALALREAISERFDWDHVADGYRRLLARTI